MASQKKKLAVLITGAGGFIGQALATALLLDTTVERIVITDVVEPAVPQPKTPSDVAISPLTVDLTSQQTCEDLFGQDFDVIYLLHGIMSGASEANLELGIKVNLDSTRRILDILRARKPGIKIIYPSTTAVYGPPASPQEMTTERTAPMPGSSYGAQKLMIETLLNDFSRRGLLDARILRLPTVTVRPGKPTGAASSFASGIFREPLNGEKATLPVPKDTEVWICSPRTVVKNLIHARDIPKEKYAGKSRTVNLPGITVTVHEMLKALENVGGKQAVELVKEKRDEATEKIVESWPPHFDTSLAQSLGFMDNGPLERTLKEYVEDYGSNLDLPSLRTS